MRIVHCATLISPDGAYGGPVRVACAHVRELTRRGHDATLIAAHRGFYQKIPTIYDGAPVQLFRATNLFPRLGFATTTAIGMLKWVFANRHHIDIVHIHLARDLVTLPVAMLCKMLRIPYVVQTHGMIDPSDRLLAKALDLLLTRPVLHTARAALYLRPIEKTELNTVARAELPCRELLNGISPVENPPQFRHTPQRVLFLARLQERKRPLDFVNMAQQLHQVFPAVDFCMVGPDEGQGSAVESAIAAGTVNGKLHWDGPIAPEKTASVIATSDLYVLPSHNEPFPMSVIEAMAAGIPVVIRDDCGLAPLVEQYGAGIVVDHSQESLNQAVQTLLSDSTRRRRAADAARELIRKHLSITSVLTQLEAIYQQALKPAKPSPSALFGS